MDQQILLRSFAGLLNRARSPNQNDALTSRPITLMIFMRTLTIEDDVLDKAKAVAAKLGAPFRRVVNEALRTGLQKVEEPLRELDPIARAAIRWG